MVLTQVNIPSIQNDSISTSDSKTISLTFFNSNSTEQKKIKFHHLNNSFIQIIIQMIRIIYSH